MGADDRSRRPAALAALDEIAVPEGARERVRRGLRAAIDARPRAGDARRRARRALAVGALVLTASTSAALAMYWRPVLTPAAHRRVAAARGPAEAATVRPQVSAPTVTAPADERPAAREGAPPHSTHKIRAQTRERAPAPSRLLAEAPASGPSELARELADYRAAVALATQDGAAALVALRRHRAEWPDGVLRHEVDLHVIRLLTRLGQRAELKREAAAFLARFPRSPRADEVRALSAQP